MQGSRATQVWVKFGVVTEVSTFLIITHVSKKIVILIK